jgi:muramoyltetrapeptide carboxypeptidase LdcA involved in peptidoglycan recycling
VATHRSELNAQEIDRRPDPQALSDDPPTHGYEPSALLGFDPVLMPNSGGGADGARDWVSGTAVERLADLHGAFADPSIEAVLSVIGGAHSAEMLPGLNVDLVRSNPKVFCGYSDTTSLLHAIHVKTGLVTFYGPVLIPEFGEPEGPDREVVDHWRHVTGSSAAAGPLPSIPWQSGESRMSADPEGPRRALQLGLGRR